MAEGQDGAAPAAPLQYDIVKVMAALPHRYPLLLVDRVVDLVVNERIHAIKAVSMNEQFFQGHFPGRPIMPGVLQIEALAQAAGVLAVESLGLAGSGKLVYFMAIEEAKFRTPVPQGKPGWVSRTNQRLISTNRALSLKRAPFQILCGRSEPVA